jgi:hypothetical protein
MISAGFEDYKRNPLYQTEQVLCKEVKCKECPANTVCEQKKKIKRKRGRKHGTKKYE